MCRLKIRTLENKGMLRHRSRLQQTIITSIRVGSGRHRWCTDSCCQSCHFESLCTSNEWSMSVLLPVLLEIFLRISVMYRYPVALKDRGVNDCSKKLRIYLKRCPSCFFSSEFTSPTVHLQQIWKGDTKRDCTSTSCSLTNRDRYMCLCPFFFKNNILKFLAKEIVWFYKHHPHILEEQMTWDRN